MKTTNYSTELPNKKNLHSIGYNFIYEYLINQCYLWTRPFSIYLTDRTNLNEAAIVVVIARVFKINFNQGPTVMHQSIRNTYAPNISLYK
jgi:hypothetical protein